MSLLNVENFDKYDYNNKDKNNKSQKHFLLPAHKSRIVICGSSGNGKSNLLLDMVKNKLVYDKLYIFSRHLHQPKYQYLIKYFNTIDKLMKDEYGIDNKTVEMIEDTLDNIPEINDLDDITKKIFIFDDFNIMTKKQEKLINDYYTRSRHKNASCIFIGQIYFLIPREIRLNLTHLILFNNGNNKEISLLYQELGSDLTKDEFKEMYNKCVNPKFNFMLIHKDAHNKHLKYRRNFTELYIPKLI